MNAPRTAPAEDIGRVALAQRRFHAVVVGEVDDEAVARPSLLPGWTVGHVLTHVARNADSHRRRAEAAAAGRVVDQYPGGYAGRADEIADGARRTAAQLIDDIQTSADRLAAAWEAVPSDAWGAATTDVGGTLRPLWALPSRRWQELVVHLADVAVGVTYRDWPADFLSVWLPRMRVLMSERIPGVDEVRLGFRDDREELAWLYGRLDRADLPPKVSWE